MDEWIEAIKTGKKSTTDFSYSGPLTETMLLGNIAIRTAKDNVILQWDSAAMKVTNHPPANELLGRQYRKVGLSDRRKGMHMKQIICLATMILALAVQGAPRPVPTTRLCTLRPTRMTVGNSRSRRGHSTSSHSRRLSRRPRPRGSGGSKRIPARRFGGTVGDAGMGPALSASDRAAVKRILADAGVRLVNFGVTDLKNDEAECRRLFDFAKDMGIETIVAEPPPDAIALVDRLCGEYGINVAIHNHPKPSPYWNPDKVLEVTRGRSSRIGACADIGHWLRSGINPMEAVKKLKGRIITFHFKDLNVAGDPEAHDVVWGTGVANVRELLRELDRQKFQECSR